MIESFDEKLFKNKETEADDGELYLKYEVLEGIYFCIYLLLNF